MVESKRENHLTRVQLDNSIILDFEGVGRSQEDPVPMPHMLGIFYPGTEDHNARYRAFLFKAGWKPVANGSSGVADVDTFENVIHSLIDEAKSREGYLIYFSDHERKVIEVHGPQFYERFLSVAFNVKPPIDRMYNRQNKIHSNDFHPSSLNEYMTHYFPQGHELGEIQLTRGAADSCRRIDKFCSDNQRWGKWSDQQKGIARELLAYNKSDCRSTWRLARKLANHLDR